MPITSYLEQNASLYSDEISLIERKYDNNKELLKKEISNSPINSLNFLSRRTLTWSEFNSQANQFANLLLSKKIMKGNKVAILMMNCLEWLPIYFGILKSGAIAVPLNYRCSADELQYCIELVECSILVFTSEFSEIVNLIHNRVSLDFIMLEIDKLYKYKNYDDIIYNISNQPPNVIISDNDLAAIYFSSGTTGFPKAILHTHSALMAAAETEVYHHKQSHEDIFLCIPPLYHTGAKMHWFGSLMSGGSAVLLCNISPRWILETMAQERATIAWLLLPWVQDILDAISSEDISIKEYDLSRWRLMHMGAQPIPEDLIHRWLTQFPYQTYDTNYGLSEAAGPGCLHLGVENIQKAGSIGKAGYGWEVSIIDENNVHLAKADIGELAVKGKGIMVGYYKDAQSTAEVLRDGWLLTGDLAYEDNDGFIFLVGRKKDLIISGGENIYPVQIENFLRNHPAVKDVAVIGLPDNRMGEVVGAFIEIKDGFHCSKSEISRYCRELPQFKRPYRIYFSEIPRNATGKIKKNELRELYANV